MATMSKTAADPVQMLKSDHRRVKELFKEYEELSDGAIKTKQRMAEEIFKELEVHTSIEEEIFYPAVCQVASQEGKDLVAEGVEEHHVVDVLMAEIRGLEPSDEAFDAKMKVLMENVEHHIEEEEQEMIPDAEDKLRGRFGDLAERMMARKKELMAK